MYPILIIPLDKAWSEEARAAAMRSRGGLSEEEKAKASERLRGLKGEEKFYGGDLGTLTLVPLKEIMETEEHPPQGTVHIDPERNPTSVREVPADRLVATQRSVTKSGVERNFDKKEVPKVTHHEGKYYIDDGHHRVAGEILAGHKTVKVAIFRRNLKKSLYFQHRQAVIDLRCKGMADRQIRPMLKSPQTTAEKDVADWREVLARPSVQRELANKLVVTGTVPYGAGKLIKGGIALDEHIPRVAKLNGVTFDPADFVRVHEVVEHDEMERLRKLGVPVEKTYLPVHVRVATPAEKWAVEKALGKGAWKPYQEMWDGWLSHIEHEKITSVPRGLYVKPYPHDKQKLLEAHEHN